MIITILNYETNKVDILKYSDELHEKHQCVEEFLEILGYDLNNILYMNSDEQTVNIYEIDNEFNKVDRAKFLL